MPYVSSDEAQIYFETTGEGPPLLLISGIASDVASWAPVVPMLAERFRLVMPDNRGAGRTQDDGPISPQDWIADCQAVLDHLEIDSAHVLGHSLGGMIAIRLALQVPERVDKLILCSTAPTQDEKALALMREMAALYESCIEPEAWFRILFQWLFAPPFFDDPEGVAAAAQLAADYEFRQSPANFRRQVEALPRFEEFNTTAIDRETLLVVAEHDLMIPPGLSQRSLEAVPGLRVQTLPGAGHSLHWDQPAGFCNIVIRFLER